MKWRDQIVAGIVAVLLYAVQVTVKPSLALSAVLFTLAGLAILFLVLSAIWGSDRFWTLVAPKVAPHLAGQGADLEAIDDVLDELATIDRRITDAINDDFYPYDFVLPGAAYEANRAALTHLGAKVRSEVRHVYILADNLNAAVSRARQAVDGDSVGLDNVNGPDPVQLAMDVVSARETLRKLRGE